MCKSVPQMQFECFSILGARKSYPRENQLTGAGSLRFLLLIRLFFNILFQEVSTYMIGQTLRLYRVNQGLTLKELSKLANLSKNHISCLERETRAITDKSRRKLLEAFKEANTPPDLLAALAYTLSNSKQIGGFQNARRIF